MGSALTLFANRSEGKRTQKNSASSSGDAKESSPLAATATLPAAFTSGDPPMCKLISSFKPVSSIDLML